MRSSYIWEALAVPDVALANSNCGCGYTVNSTTLFTNALETNFTQSGRVTWTSEASAEWQAQEYNTSAAAARGPYGKAAELQNVVVENTGLQLWARSSLLDGGADGKLVPVAEVVSSRSDFLFGSFRVGMKSTAINGTCGAFFFYHNDSEEIDLELLSKQQGSVSHLINLVNQSPESVASGYNAVNTSDFITWPLPFDPTADMHEYRFDWLPGRIDMFADGQWMRTFEDSVPFSAGALHLIHWSNGDPGWSAGPPSEDAVLTVSHVHAYFNTSSQQNSTQCSGDPAATNVCEVSANGAAPTAGSATTTSSNNSSGTAESSGGRFSSAGAASAAVYAGVILSWAMTFDS
ncbi:glycoside hydrolase family 16 protein [Teratosphaeria destructans]|uniref:Glycoside hydrolase family 16 protein n=1 Tax=Teratosphaeria destructans TaxID=418781 RepID=A0A9W7ST14_9PEZI|nr:glycoside hydrolase family 16 protein [Teratosphaeria destructans]